MCRGHASPRVTCMTRSPSIADGTRTGTLERERPSRPIAPCAAPPKRACVHAPPTGVPSFVAALRETRRMNQTIFAETSSAVPRSVRRALRGRLRPASRGRNRYCRLLQHATDPRWLRAIADAPFNGRAAVIGAARGSRRGSSPARLRRASMKRRARLLCAMRSPPSSVRRAALRRSRPAELGVAFRRLDRHAGGLASRGRRDAVVLAVGSVTRQLPRRRPAGVESAVHRGDQDRQRAGRRSVVVVGGGNTVDATQARRLAPRYVLTRRSNARVPHGVEPRRGRPPRVANPAASSGRADSKQSSVVARVSARLTRAAGGGRKRSRAPSSCFAPTPRSRRSGSDRAQSSSRGSTGSSSSTERSSSTR